MEDLTQEVGVKTTHLFGEAQVVVGRENDFQSLHEDLLVKEKMVEADALRKVKIDAEDSEEIQREKMLLISLALENSDEQVAQQGAQYLPKFGPEDSDLEKLKMELWKKALSSDWGWVRSTALIGLKPFFEPADSETTLKNKADLLRDSMETGTLDVKRSLKVDLKFEATDTEEIRKIKSELFIARVVKKPGQMAELGCSVSVKKPPF